MKDKLKRIAVCFKWSWHWTGFWRGWWHKTLTLATLAWVLTYTLLSLLITLCEFIFYPAFRLFIEPVLFGLKIDNRQAERMNKVINND